MISSKIYPLRFIATLIWIGFILAISFMEAPLKFQAPSVDLAIGLEVGRIVFGALNKVEWILLLVIMFSLILAGSKRSSNYLIIPVCIILLVQTFYLLPLLDARAKLITEGKSVPSSNSHFYYVGLEVIKLTLLVIATLKFIYNSNFRNHDNQ